jgi:hypothetical protein
MWTEEEEWINFGRRPTQVSKSKRDEKQRRKKADRKIHYIFDEGRDEKQRHKKADRKIHYNISSMKEKTMKIQ